MISYIYCNIKYISMRFSIHLINSIEYALYKPEAMIKIPGLKPKYQNWQLIYHFHIPLKLYDLVGLMVILVIFYIKGLSETLCIIIQTISFKYILRTTIFQWSQDFKV